MKELKDVFVLKGLTKKTKSRGLVVLNIALPFVQHGGCPDMVLPYRNGKFCRIRTFIKENPNPRLFQGR